MDRYEEMLAMLDAISKQVSELKAGLLQMKQTDAAADAGISGVDGTPTVLQPADELSRMVEWYNNLMKSESKPEIIDKLKHRLQEDKRLERIYFADYRRYCSDHSYAVFRRDDSGSCFVMPTNQKIGNNDIYAVFPLPANAYWYDLGKELISQIYISDKDTNSLSPRLDIARVALLRRYKDKSDDPNGYEYVPYQRGFLRFNE